MNLANPVKRLVQVLNLERKEIGSIYIFALVSGVLQLIIPIGIQAVINFSLAGVVTTSLILLILMIVVVVILIGWLQVGHMRIIEKIEQRIFTRYAFEFAWRIPRIDLMEVDDYYMPEIVNRFFDTISLQKSFSKLLLNIPTAIIQIVFGLVLLSFYSSIFVLFSFLIIIVVYFILKFTSKRGLETSIDESEYKYQLASWLEETARVFKSFHFAKNASLPVDKTDLIVTKYLNARTEHFKVLLAQYWSLIIFKVLITASTLIIGSLLLIHNIINVGQFVAAEIVILSVMSAVEKLIQSLDKVYDLLTSIEKLGKIIDKPFEKQGKIKIEQINQNPFSIQIERLSYGYEPNKKIINDFSAEIKSGQKVYLSGKEGGGKSTLLKLLTGSYQNFEGEIKINNISIRNYDLSSLRSEMGVLFNQVEIFHGTLFENITLGSKDISVNQVKASCQKVGLTDFIHSLDEGLESVLDPMGQKLSKSVSQKILLVRALIGNPKLLLLEEPWKGMDFESAEKIKTLLTANDLKTTCLIIADDKDFELKCDMSILFTNKNMKVKTK